ncbi:MAG TPA: insulinase family protein [Candidatus Scatomorpha stercorigallinarum]|nr:insulinase family protein [Candidatus Scatomorpha stercorigallinarum]
MYEKITLPNGARVVLERMEGVRSVSLGIWVGSGSRFERAEEGGSAHFIEHMLFKGTATRTAAQLAEEADSLGGQLNAYTTRDNTCFYTRVLDTHLPRAAEVLADMFFRSRFDEADVENEKGVIGEEIDMYEDTPEDVAAENLLAGCFPGALGRPVLGTEETLAGLSGRSLRAFMERTYTAPRIAVALAGSFTDADVDAVARIFAQMPPAEHTEPERSAYAPCLTLREKAVEQNQLVLGFPGLETASEERFAMQLFSNILGGSSSSRLFQTVREKHGLCYSIYSFTAGYQDTGLFAVALAANRQSERRALGLTIDELRRIRDDGVTAAELERAREQVTASILMSLESSASRMNRLGYGELFLPGGALTPDELIERYEAVTLADVRSLAQRTLDFRRASLSAVGRVADGEEYRAALLSGAK